MKLTGKEVLQNERGEIYTSRKGKEVPVRKVKDGCGINCRYKCHGNFGPQER